MESLVRRQGSDILAMQVVDAGRTEVASGTATVLAVGGVAESVDRLTGYLKTL